MICSLSLRTRVAAASSRASADPGLGRVERVPLERELVERELVDLRAPPPELDLEVPLLLEPPLLDCGMVPPSSVLAMDAPYLASAHGCCAAATAISRRMVSMRAWPFLTR